MIVAVSIPPITVVAMTRRGDRAPILTRSREALVEVNANDVMMIGRLVKP
jgi:hypothetical protein